MTTGAWLIPAVPFVSAFLAFFLGRRVPYGAQAIAIAGTAFSLVYAAVMLPGVLNHPAQVHLHSTTFSPTGAIDLTIGTYIDGLSALVTVMVCAVAVLVQIYSTAYLHGDQRYPSYASWISMFTSAMLLVVLASDLFELYAGWEVMGLCSYLLIGHYWESRKADHAAIKAFLTTRLGDVPFLFGIFVIGSSAGSFRIDHLGSAAHGSVVIGTLLMLGGVAGKSAQFPLQTWLPDAMAGPTPVSALIHAATMVAAGVYVVARLYPLFASSGTTLDVLGIAAVITMLLAALAALAQDDLKRVLAYSTVSQLAYMTGGLAVGGYQAGLYHLINHAAFKALLFLGAGSVLHAVGSNYMSDMGGLWRKMPVTFVTFAIGSAALAGLPPFSGAFSKDSILDVARTAGFGDGAEVPVGSGVAQAVYIGGLITVALTAVYTTRMVLRTFFGDYRGKAHLHESPLTMTAPLMLLAVPALGLGFGAMHGAFPSWLPNPVEGLEELKVAPSGLAISGSIVLVAALGLFALWRARPAGDPADVIPAGVRSFLIGGLGFDTLYDVAVVRPVAAGGRFLADVDRTVVDGAVDGTGRLTRIAAGAVRFTQNGNMQQYATGVFAGVLVIAIVVVLS